MTGSETTPTWGYRPDGSAEIFDLGPGETLPEGWHPSPDVITDPARATAEALSATVARAAQAPRRPVAPRRAPDAGAEGAKLSHPSLVTDQIEALRAENARLCTENAELRQALAASHAAQAEAVARLKALTEQVAESMASVPVADGGQDAPDQPTADPAAAPARTRDEAREAVRILLGEGLTDREIARRVGVSPSTVAAVRKAAGA
jgi:hypothetical protein